MTSLTSPAAQPALGLPNNMPDVIDSLKRLERIGSENSKTTEKLVAAAEQLANRIGELCAPELNDNFTVTVNGFPQYIFFKNKMCQRAGRNVIWDRTTALQFAEDIAKGLLDCIILKLKDELQTSDRALQTLETAAGALREKTS